MNKSIRKEKSMFFKKANMILAVAVLISISGHALAREFTPYESPDKTFRCVVPAGWSIVESPSYSREVSGVDGFDAYRGGFEDRVTISIRYYPPGNKLHKDMDAYIRAYSQPVLTVLEGQTYGPVKDLDFRGTKARTFERSGYDYESHVYNPKLDRYVEPLHPRKVEYRERFIVMPLKTGFAAFRFKAGPDTAGQYEDVFARVADSFSFEVK
jgi:hypothetical protein